MVRSVLMLLLVGSASYAAPVAERTAKNDLALAKALAGRTAGPAQNCLPARTTESATYGRTVLYRDGARLWRTELGAGCGEPRDVDILVTRQPQSRTCAGDIVQVRDSLGGFTRGSCAFSEFVPYSR